MQVFIVGSPLETARALDGARLRKQIIEAQQIIDALNGAKAWSNHPAVLQYREHIDWLKCYYNSLMLYARGLCKLAQIESYCAESCALTPYWHSAEYFDQMKRRLYTKDPEYYKQWSHLGKSDENWYFVDGEWRKYVNGKRVE